jgi:hypothetical protein
MLSAIMPKVSVVKKVSKTGRRTTVRDLCLKAGVECRVTGVGAGREVWVQTGVALRAEREPGSLGRVSVGLLAGTSKEVAVSALGLLAYVVFDYAARESMRGRPEASLVPPRGRPRKPHPLSGAERQRRWRARAATATTSS